MKKKKKTKKKKELFYGEKDRSKEREKRSKKWKETD